jgi:hypothetical protein
MRSHSPVTGGRATTITKLPLLTALLLAGCAAQLEPLATPAIPTTTPEATASPSVTAPARPTDAPTDAMTTVPSPADTPATFTSDRHGYRVDVPRNWQVHEYEGEWTNIDEFIPGGEVPGEDVIAPPPLFPFLVMNSMPIPDGDTEQQWLAEFDAVVHAGLPEDCPGMTEQGTIAGVDATVITQDCDGFLTIGRSLAHNGRGYYFTTRSSTDSAASIDLLADLVGSIQFVESAGPRRQTDD